LQTPDIHLEPAPGAKYGYLHVRDGKSKYAKRNVSLSARVTAMLRARLAAATSLWVFDNGSGGPWLGTSLNHQHSRVRTLLKLPQDFVIHSFRHTMLTRLGEAGADAFTIMRIAGHSSVTVSQRYVHPSPESLERAFEKLEACYTAAQEPKVGVGIISGIAADSGIAQNPGKRLQ
ncbi:MAG TPA: tyrosine-type recombinase/integrase, partial [Bryobacteraceae bacterium]|nr:tyrosine-type recombinase/integrase [Bryobacteraceae bacterium]